MPILFSFNQIPFFFLSDKCELTAGSDDKKTAQPRRISNLGILIAGQTLKPLSYEGSIPGGAVLCFFPSDPAVSSHLSDRKKKGI